MQNDGFVLSYPSWFIKKEYIKSRYLYYESSVFNGLTIRRKGVHVATTLNNMLIVSYQGSGWLDDSSHQEYDVGMEGHVALQLYRGTENLIRFKDIESFDER